MKILWITNILLPPICKELGKDLPVYGGWMYSSLKHLREHTEHKFAVASVYSGNELISKEIDGIVYYLLPIGKHKITDYNFSLEKYWSSVKKEWQPDAVHIHGSEFPHGLAYVNSCGAENVVVSLQGLISSISEYYTAGISSKDILKNITIRDILRNDTIFKQKKRFEKRGRYEIELLSKVKHIIGRTGWDKIHSWAINPDAAYHYCGETLRDIFYEKKWEYEKCKPHSIFISQGAYPIKGLHKVIEALPIVLKHYPDTTVYVAGENIIDLPLWRISGYGSYLKRLVSKHNLRDRIKFTGMLNAEAMCRQYLGCNLFVCPSAIENSPNSLAEAQSLGMPHIASFAGGIPDIVNMNPAVLYRFEETAALAKKICDIFKSSNSYSAPPFNAERYDIMNNLRLLENIYTNIYAAE